MEAASAVSAVVEQQSQQKQVTSQKTQKKKSKNKKATGKNCGNSSPAADEVLANHNTAHANAAKNGEQAEESAGTTTTAAVAANGLCAKLEQQLYIAGDSHQINGSAAKCCSHATLNGHHTPAADGDADKSNGTCAAAVHAQHPKSQQSQQSALTDSSGSGSGSGSGSASASGNGNGKKSKSKSNKKNNKEVARQSLNSSKVATNNGGTCAAASVVHNLAASDTMDTANATAAAAAAAAKEQATVAVQLENGFSHENNVNSNNAASSNSNGAGNGQTNALQHEHHAASAVSETSEVAAPATHPADQVKAIGTAAAAVVAAVVATATATVANSSCDAQTSQLPAAVTTSAHNLKANANANANTNLTANANSNTAKPNDAVNANANATPAAVAATAQMSAAATPATAIGTGTGTETDATTALDLSNVHIEYKEYESELQMHDIMRLIQAELSEPYSIYTYRYFIYNWPKLCFLAAHGDEYVGAIVCKLDMHMNVRRGYIAMLAVRKEYRKLKIGTTLVQKAIEAMLADNADEVVLETEMRNVPALRLYENLGFVRDKRLFRYYLNGVDALRLKLWFR